MSGRDRRVLRLPDRSNRGPLLYTILDRHAISLDNDGCRQLPLFARNWPSSKIPALRSISRHIRAVARERSFSRATAQPGVSQSALSQTTRGIETRLGLRLLSRTTRSVSPTEAGERLLQSVGPRFDDIKAELAALSALREKPAGTIRITAGDHAVPSLLWPKLHRLGPDRHRCRALRCGRAARRTGREGHDLRANWA